MNKILLSLLIFGANLQAAQLNQPQAGSSARSSVDASSSWQNWAFAGTMVVTAAAGVLAASVASGSNAQSH